MVETIVNQTKLFQNNGRELFYQTYESRSLKPKASLLITHGQGEHSEAYKELANRLCLSLPLKIYAWDMVGHGKSSGQRGYVGDISWLTQDFVTMVNLCKRDNADLTLHLLSHSLGGLIHLYCEQEELFDTSYISSSILSNPCVALNFTPPKWKSLGAEFLTKTAPRITLGNEIKPSQLSSDPEYLEIFKKDPLRHQSISPRFYLGMLELMNSLSKKRKKQHPTLTLLSPKDSVCASNKSEAYLSDSSDFLFFEKSAHEVLNDIEKESATNAVKEFLNENI